MFAPHRYYYLHNFQQALDWVGERYGDLMDDSEQQFLTRFGQLSQSSRALLVRLLLRCGPWFLESKIAYEEIPDVREASAPLLDLGWIDAQHPMGLKQLFTLHTKAELLQFLPCAPIHASMRKGQMLLALLSEPSHDQPYSEWNPQSRHSAWHVTVGDVCQRLRLMYFGNLHQGWSEFVLADLGIFQYEKVEFDWSSRAFECREDVDCYLAIQQCRQSLEEGQPPEALLVEAANCHSANPWLETRRAKLLLRIGQRCERTQLWELAEQSYAQSQHPNARHRRMRVYERTDRFADALALAQAAHSAPGNEEEGQRVGRMLPRLRRRMGVSPDRRTPLIPAAPLMRSDLELDLPDQPMAVEDVVRDHWSSKLAPVFYVENTLINSLFGLLCWPAIFAPLPGAFFHPFQSGPADLEAPDFVARRAIPFEVCLGLLGNGSYRDVIRQRYLDKQGVQSSFVFWGAITQQLLDLALECIPPEHLRLFFVRMMDDLKANRTGFPDLVRFWPAERRYELVEVKGPGDKVQDNQVRWLQYFSEHGIPASVCHVRWRETAGPQRLQTMNSEKVTS